MHKERNNVYDFFAKVMHKNLSSMCNCPYKPLLIYYWLNLNVSLNKGIGFNRVVSVACLNYLLKRLGRSRLIHLIFYLKLLLRHFVSFTKFEVECISWMLGRFVIVKNTFYYFLCTMWLIYVLTYIFTLSYILQSFHSSQ